MPTIPRRVWFTLVPHAVYFTLSDPDMTREQVSADMRQFGLDFLSVIEESPAPQVHLIIDARASRGAPPMREAMSAPFLRHPRLGYTITIGGVNNPVLRVMLSLLRAMVRGRYQDVGSLDDACNLLIAKDAALPPLHTWSLPTQADTAAALKTVPYPEPESTITSQN